MIEIFIVSYLKIFFILTPFFILSSFLSMTAAWSVSERRKLALKVSFAVLVIVIILFFVGQQIFSLFGITINSFKAGTGALLFLSAVSLIRGDAETGPSDENDISVVPLAIPIAVGPATTGAILVMGVELSDVQSRVAGVCALVSAVFSICILLYSSVIIEKFVKKRGLNILSKITGLILAAISAQMIMSGIKGFFGL
ncbi:MAG: MarC family protein [Spirochaetes bacterium]|nr:MarC family protein [Spirochaetota bacterium]